MNRACVYVWVVGGKWEGGGLSKLRKQLSKGSEAWDLIRGLKEAGDKAGQPEVGGGGWDAEESLYSGLFWLLPRSFFSTKG